MKVPGCVVDANIGIKLFLNYEEDSELVADLFSDQLRDPAAGRIAVPGFFYIECASILRKAVRAGQYTAIQARQDLADLAAMGLHTVPTSSLAGEAFQIASVYGVSVYDACYVALSDRLGVPLITADERLINCLSGSAYTLMSIAQFIAMA
jgi:predicted nucleic acid-binding protein